MEAAMKQPGRPAPSGGAPCDPFVCVVVLNCNGREHLEYCLRSMTSTDYPNYKVLLVDNASADGSVDFVANEYPQVVVVRSDRNLGWSGGNNLGVRMSIDMDAKYVVLANNDIKVDPAWLRGAVSVAERDERIGIVGFDVFEAGGRFDNDSAFVAARQAFRSLELLPSGNVGGMSMFIRADLFREIGFIDEGYFVYGEEVDFQIRAERAGYRVAAINVPVWHYGQGFFSKVPARAAMLQTRSNIRLLIKHSSLSTIAHSAVRHFRIRVLGSRSREAARSAVEYRLSPSRSAFVNLGLLLYATAWNLWFLPRTLRRRREDYRRVAGVRRKWA
jgi:GT2 family glycosyltransferase